MKKMNTFRMICLLAFACCFSFVSQGQELELPLDALNLNSNGDINSYDPATHTITYGGEWQYYGWTYEEQGGKDFSDYDLVVVEFDTSGLPTGTTIELEIAYMDGDRHFASLNTPISFVSEALKSDKKDQVKHIFVKSQNPGEIVLFKAYALKIQDHELPLIGLNLKDAGVTFDLSTGTVYYNKAENDWSWIAWEIGNPGKDASAYSKVTIEFEPLEIEALFIAQYNGREEHGVNVYPGATSATVELDPEEKHDVKGIYLKGKGTGSIKILRAYFVADDGKKYEFPLDNLNLNSNGDINSYDPATHTITYGDNWHYFGWRYESVGGKDFSGYDLVVLEFDGSGLPAPGPSGENTKVHLSVLYMEDDNIDQRVRTEVRCTSTFVTVPLDKEKGNVKHIAIWTEFPGTLVVNNAYALKIEDNELPTALINMYEDADTKFDLTTNTASYAKGANDFSWVAWGLGTPGKDCSAYNTFTIEFEPLEIEANITFQYNGAFEDHGGNAQPGETSLSIPLHPEGKADVKNIFLKGKGTGSIIVKNAYFEIEEELGPDLIVTDILWSPAEPEGGEQIVFSAVIKNIGDEATPDNVKHGVAFSVDGTTVSWSDTHMTSLAPGEEITLTANGGIIPDANYWIAGEGKNLKYTIKAHVNDNLDDGIQNEKDITNNTLEKDLIINPEADLIVTELTWEPEILTVGQEVSFTAVIKNQGYAATPDNVKHGVAFSVNGVTRNWNDEHYTSMAPGEEVTLKANGGPAGKATWTCTIAGNLIIRAEVNDTRNIPESDTDNNTLTKEVIVTGMAAINGNRAHVYVKDGILMLNDYSSPIHIGIYDLFGKLILSKKNVSNNVPVYLPSGIYIVQVEEMDNKKENYKIVIE